MLYLALISPLLVRLRRMDKGLLALLVLLVVTAPVISKRIYASDEVKYLAYTQSLFFDKDLNFTNEYLGWYMRNAKKYAFIGDLLKPEPATGRPINEAPIGTGLLWLPFFIGADMGVRAARALGAHIAADGYSAPYIWAVCYASFAYGWAGLLLIYQVLRGLFGSFAGALAVIVAWLATPAFHYMVVAPPWSHAASLFAVSLFVLVWYRTRGVPQRRPWQWLALGACAGLMMLIREQDALFLSIPAVEAALWGLGIGGWGLGDGDQGSGIRGQGSKLKTLPLSIAKGQNSKLKTQNSDLPTPNPQPPTPRLAALPRVIGGWALMLGAAVVVVHPQLLAYHAVNGSWGPSKTVAQKLTWWSPHFFEVLLSPHYGLLVWTPVIVLGLAGLVWLARRDPTVAVAFGVALLAQVFVAGAFLTWQSASSFGQRRFINATVIIAFGLAALIAAARGRGVPRWSVAAVAALFIAWNLGLEVQYATLWTTAQREAGLRWPDVLVQQVTLPPRLPGLAWRLLTNPSTFYNPEGAP